MLQDFVIPEAEDSHALGFQVLRSCPIVRFGVLGSIQFDGQTLRLTVEIHDVWRNRMLPTKLESIQPAASQVVPKLLLGIRN